MVSQKSWVLSTAASSDLVQWHRLQENHENWKKDTHSLESNQRQITKENNEHFQRKLQDPIWLLALNKLGPEEDK